MMIQKFKNFFSMLTNLSKALIFIFVILTLFILMPPLTGDGICGLRESIQNSPDCAVNITVVDMSNWFNNSWIRLSSILNIGQDDDLVWQEFLANCNQEKGCALHFVDDSGNSCIIFESGAVGNSIDKWFPYKEEFHNLTALMFLSDNIPFVYNIIVEKDNGVVPTIPRMFIPDYKNYTNSVALGGGGRQFYEILTIITIDDYANLDIFPKYPMQDCNSGGDFSAEGHDLSYDICFTYYRIKEQENSPFLQAAWGQRTHGDLSDELLGKMLVVRGVARWNTISSIDLSIGHKYDIIGDGVCGELENSSISQDC
jgi:hypothetical protein